jgi:hypothetical protein
MKHGSFPADEATPRPFSPTTLIRGVKWPTFLSGLTLGLVILHVCTTGPLTDQVRQLQQQLGAMRSDVSRLASASSNVQQAGSLLAAINEQQTHIAAARQTLQSIEQLHRDVRTEAARAVEAHQALDGLVAINSRLIGARQQLEPAGSALKELRDLQSEITMLGQSAAASREELQSTDAALAELNRLKGQVVAAAEQIDTAEAALADLRTIRDDVIDAGTGTADAQTAIDGLAMLQASIPTVDEVATAADNAEQLIALQRTLAADERLSLEQAGVNLDQLLSLQTTIAEQSEQLADSIDTLDLMSEFQEEFRGQLSQVEQLRRQATELMLLESTLTRAFNALAPLAELGDLRRLDENEMKEVARMLLERRRSRVGMAESKIRSPAPVEEAVVEEDTLDRPVPTPPVAE